MDHFVDGLMLLSVRELHEESHEGFHLVVHCAFEGPLAILRDTQLGKVYSVWVEPVPV